MGESPHHGFVLLHPENNRKTIAYCSSTMTKFENPLINQPRMENPAGF